MLPLLPCYQMHLLRLHRALGMCGKQLWVGLPQPLGSLSDAAPAAHGIAFPSSRYLSRGWKLTELVGGPGRSSRTGSDASGERQGPLSTVTHRAWAFGGCLRKGGKGRGTVERKGRRSKGRRCSHFATSSTRGRWVHAILSACGGVTGIERERLK